MHIVELTAIFNYNVRLATGLGLAPNPEYSILRAKGGRVNDTALVGGRVIVVATGSGSRQPHRPDWGSAQHLGHGWSKKLREPLATVQR